MLRMVKCPDGQMRRESGLYVKADGKLGRTHELEDFDLTLHGTSPRGIDPGSSTGLSQLAFGDQQFYEFVYNDVSGSLSIGQPVYVDIRDAAQFSSSSSYPSVGLTPATGRTGGKVVLGTTAAGTGANLMCVGIFQPDDQSLGLLPNNGDVIRVLAFGRGIVAAESPGGGTAGTVGGVIIASAAVPYAIPGARTSGLNIGILIATRTYLASGAVIFAAASATPTLCNAFVNLT